MSFLFSMARERVARFYEFSFLYPREHDYDAWLGTSEEHEKEKQCEGD